jgi:hypothetical protein
MKKNILTKIAKLSPVTLYATIILPSLVEADVTTGLKNPLKDDYGSIPGLMTGLMNVVVEIGAVVAVFAIIWVGFMYVKAMGNPEKVKEAHKALLYVCIGIAILVGAKVITAIVTNTINQVRG